MSTWALTCRGTARRRSRSARGPCRPPQPSQRARPQRPPALREHPPHVLARQGPPSVAPVARRPPSAGRSPRHGAGRRRRARRHRRRYPAAALLAQDLTLDPGRGRARRPARAARPQPPRPAPRMRRALTQRPRPARQRRPGSPRRPPRSRPGCRCGPRTHRPPARCPPRRTAPRPGARLRRPGPARRPPPASARLRTALAASRSCRRRRRRRRLLQPPHWLCHRPAHRPGPPPPAARSQEPAQHGGKMKACSEVRLQDGAVLTIGPGIIHLHISFHIYSLSYMSHDPFASTFPPFHSAKLHTCCSSPSRHCCASATMEPGRHLSVHAADAVARAAVAAAAAAAAAGRGRRAGPAVARAAAAGQVPHLQRLWDMSRGGWAAGSCPGCAARSATAGHNEGQGVSRVVPSRQASAAVSTSPTLDSNGLA